MNKRNQNQSDFVEVEQRGGKMSKKRKFQLYRKEYYKYKGRLQIWVYSLATVSFLLARAAKYVYKQHPHSWYGITGRIDVLLLTVAIMITFVSFILKVDISRAEYYLGIKKPTAFTLFTLFFPFLLLALSLFVSSSLYITPIACSFLAFIYMTYRAKRKMSESQF